MVAVLACNDGKRTEPAPEPDGLPAAPPGPATLVFELPAGVKVSVDGGEQRAMPVEPLEVAPGEHTLTLVTTCQQLEVRIEARAGRTTRVDRERAEGLGLATVKVTARGLDGEALTHTVAIGDTVVGSGDGSSNVTVPACRYRVKVASEGLGGFIEDIDFGEEKAARREIVLAPGPDMVRIHGGAFTLGPPASSERTEARWDTLWPRKDVVSRDRSPWSCGRARPTR